MRRLLMIIALVLVAGLMLVPAALAQQDELTVQEGPPLTASPTANVQEGPPLSAASPTPSANLEDDVILNTTTPTATVTVQEGPPLSASPTAGVAGKDQYDDGGTKKKEEEVVVGGGGGRTLPETGGVSSIALLAGALLIVGGLLSWGLFRRS